MISYWTTAMIVIYDTKACFYSLYRQLQVIKLFYGDGNIPVINHSQTHKFL